VRWRRGCTAVGLLGVGFLVIPVLSSSAAYAFAELFEWRHGLDLKMRRATRFYTVILIATLGGVVMHFTHLSAMRALFWAGVLNGVLAPFLLGGVLVAAYRHKLSPRGESITVAAAIAAMLAATAMWLAS